MKSEKTFNLVNAIPKDIKIKILLHTLVRK